MIVADIMSKQVHSVSPEETLEELRNIFSDVAYRHLLVEENDRLVGVVSDRDALAHLSPFLRTEEEREIDRSLLKLKVRDIMSAAPITVDADTGIDCASILLLENPISCLPVVREDMSIEGILSWTDILQFHVYDIDKTLHE
ncbi:CBS domain-containing protein [Teredinibacter haidensis]|uniref:CBS domain-containing protein n=1 Tax=Teredinibacter haidensis TaxID=2731755 RepID=UPI000948AC46|nr:CBS domain-containing protein [Teredinibacter haidensis]